MKNLTYILFLLLFSTSYSQQNFHPKEITFQGDNIIIPESKLEEFLKNYTSKKNITLTKQTGEITLDGYVNDALTTEPIENVATTLYLYDWPTPIDTLGPILTDFQGYWSFTVTDVEDQQTINNQTKLQYHGNKILTNNINEKTLKIYDVIGQEVKNIKTNNHEIDINLEGIASGLYITILELEKKTYANLIMNSSGKVAGHKKIEEHIIVENKKLNKTKTQLVGLIDYTPPNNQHHRYGGVVGIDGYILGDTRTDISLFPRINLENPIVDPEYTVIPTIETLRDLWWYAVRFQGQPFVTVKMLFPIKLFIDSSNAPTGWIPEIRDVIQFYQDSLEIHPDSLIKENPVYTEPSYYNGYSAINIIYTDSTEIGQQYTTFDIVFSSSNNTIIGGWIKINVPKITNKEDAGMILARQIEVYTTQTIDRIKDPRYLGNTSYNNLGTTRRPNNDEKKWIKTGRFSKPFWFGGIFP